MRQRKTLSEWLTNKYLVIVRDEENFEEKATFSLNIARTIAISVVLMIILGPISYFLTSYFTSSPDAHTTYLKQVIELEEKVDSLQVQSELKDKFLGNIRNILEGNVELELTEQVTTNANFDPSVIDLEGKVDIDSQFRKEFENVGYELLSYENTPNDDFFNIYFFPPLQGVISARYDVKKRHYGTDIVAKKNEPIKAIADGTVILSSWTQDSGYVIAIQHKNQLISFYKHNSVLLKNVGETVKGGDLVAIIGNTGEHTDGPHLHFELWYNGNHVNPEDFISF